MVDEYLSEREQAELLRQWLRENWLWLFSGIALGLGGLYGYRWWEGHHEQRSLAAEQRFTAMLAALERNARDEGVRIAGEITGEYDDTPYADQTTLVLARLDVEAGVLAQAANRLGSVMNTSRDPELALVARLRLARVQLAQGQYDAALATLDGAKPAAAAARVAELRGDVLQARGDLAGALAAYQQAQQAAAGGQVDPELLALKIESLAAQQKVE
ncbi:MAG: tetratricopeptide repeat protein [Gammaproteobacteria bacterium]|nr:tetratricopeptide repeat protein [Gammaproteobacteria bacterium]